MYSKQARTPHADTGHLNAGPRQRFLLAGDRGTHTKKWFRGACGKKAHQ